MEQNNGTNLQELPNDAAYEVSQTEPAPQGIGNEQMVTSYGVVTRKYVESLIEKKGSLEKKSKKSTGKRVFAWFIGIVGCLAFLFSCGCLCFHVFRYVFSPSSESFDGFYTPYDDDFFFIPDDGIYDDDNNETSDSDIYFDSTETSDAGLGVVVSALDPSISQLYGISGGLVIAGIQPDSAFAGTDVMEYDIITMAEGVEITSTTVLSVLLNKHQIGDEFTMTITRFSDGYAESFEVTVNLIDKTAVN